MNKINSADEDNEVKRLHGIVFAALMTYIENLRDESEVVPVFKLSEHGTI